MQYGAYRRWKEAEMEVKKGGGNTKTKKQKKNNNKKEKDSTTDSFYNAIKNLGSGPTEKVELQAND